MAELLSGVISRFLMRTGAIRVGWLISAIAREAQELPLHRIDPSNIRRDEVIAAAFTGYHLEIATRESRGGAWAAEMDEGGYILFLLRVCGHCRAGENRGHIAVQIHRSQLDGVARDCANVGTEPATRIRDGVRSDAKAGGFGVGRIGQLEEADGAGEAGW
jgi:hypothetical protein